MFKMKLIAGAIFFIGAFSLEIISGFRIHEDPHATIGLDCVHLCPYGETPGIYHDDCNCKFFLSDSDQLSSNETDGSDKKLAKRDTIQEQIKKISRKNKQKNINLFPASKPNKRRQFAPGPKSRPALSPAKQPQLIKNLQARLGELKARMASKAPLLQARANLDEKPNLIEQIKSRQEELMEKLRNSKNKDSLNRLRNRIDVDNGPKVGLGLRSKKFDEKADLASNSSTEPAKSGPIVVILSSTTSPSVNNEIIISKTETTTPSVIERIKEKQKETVTKIKDKISTSLIKANNAGKKR